MQDQSRKLLSMRSLLKFFKSKQRSRNIENGGVTYSEIYEAVSSTAIIAITDVKGRIVEVNDKFCEVSGYSRKELIGQDHRILNSGYHCKEFFQKMWQQILSGKTWTGEIKNRKKNGDYYWVLTSIKPSRSANNEIEKFISVRFEVTEFKNTQEMLAQSSKMAVLGEMASGITHEINNPLAVILARAQVLIQKAKDPNLTLQGVVKDIEKIEEVCKRISKIIIGLRSYVRKSDAEPMETVSVKSILEYTEDISRSITQKARVQLTILPFDETHIHCRSAQIEQILLCLITNSCDAVAGTSDPWIRVELETKNNSIYFMVTDSGLGIAPEILDKLMSPFFTTKGQGKGTGLGLSISKNLAIEHGGELYYNSNSKNTQFVLKIPTLHKDQKPKVA